MAMRVEKISAVTFRVWNMKTSVQFYRDVLGMELLYGGEGAGFSSLRAKDMQSAILNLERGHAETGWGRLIFHVADVDSSGRTFAKRDFVRRGRETPPGANGISTCSTRTGMSCRLRDRSSSLRVGA